MPSFPPHPRHRALALGVLLAIALSSAAYAATTFTARPARDDFRIGLTPIGAYAATGSGDDEKMVVIAGRSRRVRVTFEGGAGRARLRFGAIPGGVQARFAQSTLSTDDGSTTVTIDVARSMRRVTFPLTVRAEDGRGRPRSATVDVNVRYLVATPRVVSLQAGDRASVALALRRMPASQPTTLSMEGLPAGVTAAFDPATTSGPRAALTLATDAARTPAGTFRVRVVSRWGSSGHSSTGLVLKVRRGATRTFRVTGSVADLAPGVSRPVNLRLTGAAGDALRVLDLRTAIVKVTAPRATAARPCELRDFAVTQYRGGALALPAGQTRTLSALGVPTGSWPQITMVDRPVNQDGCQTATLTLAFVGSAAG